MSNADADGMAARREAFIASERARRAAETGVELTAPARSITSPVAQGQPRSGRPTGYAETHFARAYQGARPEKSLLVAYLLWFLLCGVSAHRFYLGAYRSACAQLGCIFGGGVLVGIAAGLHTNFPGWVGALGIVLGVFWMLADVFLLPGVHRRMRAKWRAANVDNVFA